MGDTGIEPVTSSVSSGPTVFESLPGQSYRRYKARSEVSFVVAQYRRVPQAVAALDGKRLTNSILERLWDSTRERVGADGNVRYTATYRDLRGRQRSAGTFGHAAPGRPGLAAGGVQGRPGLLRRPQPRAPDVPRLRGADVAAEPRDRGEHPAVLHVRPAPARSCRSSGRCG